MRAAENPCRFTLRHNGRLHHIGLGRTYAGTYIRLLVEDLQIIVLDAATGEVLRELTLNPTKDYQPISAHHRPTPDKQTGRTYIP